jgi:hypothetical protein
MFRTMNRRGRAWILLVLFVALAPLLTGCYGRFQTTRSIYKWNAEVSDDKLVRSVVMWGLLVVPVYSIGGLADVVVLNPIDYWQGTKIEVGSKPDAKGTTVTLAPVKTTASTVAR